MLVNNPLPKDVLALTEAASLYSSSISVFETNKTVENVIIIKPFYKYNLKYVFRTCSCFVI